MANSICSPPCSLLRSGSSRVINCSRGAASTTTRCTTGRSTFRCCGCGERSKPIPRSRNSSSPNAAWVIFSDRRSKSSTEEAIGFRRPPVRARALSPRNVRADFIRNRCRSGCSRREIRPAQIDDSNHRGEIYGAAESRLEARINTESTLVPRTSLRLSRVALGTWAMRGLMCAAAIPMNQWPDPEGGGSGHQPRRYGAGI